MPQPPALPWPTCSASPVRKTPKSRHSYEHPRALEPVAVPGESAGHRQCGCPSRPGADKAVDDAVDELVTVDVGAGRQDEQGGVVRSALLGEFLAGLPRGT